MDFEGTLSSRESLEWCLRKLHQNGFWTRQVLSKDRKDRLGTDRDIGVQGCREGTEQEATS